MSPTHKSHSHGSIVTTNSGVLDCNVGVQRVMMGVTLGVSFQSGCCLQQEALEMSGSKQPISKELPTASLEMQEVSFFPTVRSTAETPGCWTSTHHGMEKDIFLGPGRWGRIEVPHIRLIFPKLAPTEEK